MSEVFVDVDTQHDFCHRDGSLSVPGSPNATFAALTSYAMAHQIPIVGSVDSHAYDAWEFASNNRLGPDGANPQFPDHCVKGTAGWLKIAGTLPQRFRFVANQQAPFNPTLLDELLSGQTQSLLFEKEVYSFFANPQSEALIAALVKRRPSSRFVVYGVATDYCVKAAALGLAERGYRVAVLEDAIAGIADEGIALAWTEMGNAGIERLRCAELNPPLPSVL